MEGEQHRERKRASPEAEGAPMSTLVEDCSGFWRGARKRHIPCFPSELQTYPPPPPSPRSALLPPPLPSLVEEGGTRFTSSAWSIVVNGVPGMPDLSFGHKISDKEAGIMFSIYKEGKHHFSTMGKPGDMFNFSFDGRCFDFTFEAKSIVVEERPEV